MIGNGPAARVDRERIAKLRAHRVTGAAFGAFKAGYPVCPRWRETVIMQRDDVVTQVRIRARLNGPNHARSVIRAVMLALRPVVPDADWRDLATQLPPELKISGGSGSAGGDLVRDVAALLNVGEHQAAFYARVTFEQLNSYCRGVTPAGIARSLPVELRPLLTARVDDPARRHRLVLRSLGAAVPTLSLRAPRTAQPVARTTATVIETTIATTASQKTSASK